MSKPIVRLGDTSSHGGAVTSAASRWNCVGIAIARRGDAFVCPIHGSQTIASGSGKYQCEGAPIARQGDTITCGASLVSSQSKWTCA
ncbi:PAAR domain-containing protein [Bosea sp. MMO-172]|uniref:PAAR domain-containing protein n=1 Tax=Bosea sp. MMO-172 TaxID=3127885 RepID=UPI00301A1943